MRTPLYKQTWLVNVRTGMFTLILAYDILETGETGDADGEVMN